MLWRLCCVTGAPPAAVSGHLNGLGGDCLPLLAPSTRSPTLKNPRSPPGPQLTCRTCRSHWSRLFNVEGCTGSENFVANIEEPRPNNPVTRGSSAIGKLVMIGVVQYSFVEKNRSSHFGFVSTSLGFKLFGLAARCRSRGIRRCTESDQDRKKRTIESYVTVLVHFPQPLIFAA